MRRDSRLGCHVADGYTRMLWPAEQSERQGRVALKRVRPYKVSVDFEQCKDNLDSLIDRRRLEVSDLNEATTRLHLIDELIFSALLGIHVTASARSAMRANTADYTLGKPFKFCIWRPNVKALPSPYRKVSQVASFACHQSSVQGKRQRMQSIKY